MAYILPDGRGTASISAAVFAERCLLQNKVLNVFDCERHWGSRQSVCSRLRLHLWNLTHWHTGRYKLLFSGKVYRRQINIKSDKQKEFNISVDVLKAKTFFFPKQLGKVLFIYLLFPCFVFFCFFTLWLSTEFSQCGKPKRILYAYETLSLTILTLASCQKFAPTQWI